MSFRKLHVMCLSGDYDLLLADAVEVWRVWSFPAALASGKCQTCFELHLSDAVQVCQPPSTPPKPDRRHLIQEVCSTVNQYLTHQGDCCFIERALHQLDSVHVRFKCLSVLLLTHAAFTVHTNNVSYRVLRCRTSLHASDSHDLHHRLPVQLVRR